ncbi:MAG: 2-amino-4-hydroxy-6-hydroxymethyldihydropteridine diphosphokinase [Candidatus Limnocylindrales bacterium]
MSPRAMSPRSSATRHIRAYVGLGANLGDPAESLAWAVGALGVRPDVRVGAVSRLFRTAPWGVLDQPDFRNAVASLEVTLGADPAAGALELLRWFKELEREAGRRAGSRWGPRGLDLDLLVFGRHRIRVERPADARSLDAAVDAVKAARLLEVPHRELGQRLFVLAPLADLAPRLVPPGWHETVERARRRLAAREPAAAVRAIGSWDPDRGRWTSDA